MTREILEEHRQVWNEKPVLRFIYADFYRRILSECRPGKSLEVGGGFGNLKQYVPDVVSTDLVLVAGLDVAADAQALPFRDRSFDNIVAVDVLHHLERPQLFFSEASRVLRSGGRVVLVEPGITPVSWIFYKFLHPEPVVLSLNPFREVPLDPDRKPFDANQGIPELIFGRYLRDFTDSFPTLRVVRRKRFAWLAYPLSGGFRPWSLVPERALKTLLTIEEKLAPYVAWFSAFRLLIVLERVNSCDKRSGVSADFQADAY